MKKKNANLFVSYVDNFFGTKQNILFVRGKKSKFLMVVSKTEERNNK